MCNKLNKLGNLYVKEDYQKTVMNLFEEANWNIIPVDIEKILHNLNIPFSKKDFSNSEEQLKQKQVNAVIQGMVHVEHDNIRIFYNPIFRGKEVSQEKKRFTLAHELAHCILHTKEIDENSGFLDLYRRDEEIDYKSENGKKEYETNALAGEILMPKEIFVLLYQILIEKTTFTETVHSLSQIFNVSKSVVKAKIDYLKL